MPATYRLLRTWPDPRMQRLAEWTATMLAAAEKTAAKIGCSPAAIVAQAALETGWGAHTVGRHNLFGIKATPGWTGERVLVHTREVINGQSVMIDDWFRDYPSFEASIADHFRFLVENKRYEQAGVFDPTGVKSDQEYFDALQRAGYATDPNYAATLGAMLRSVHALMQGMARVETGAAAAAPAPAVAALPRLLHIGLAGTDVTHLQATLNRAGYQLTIDGQFGPETMRAVRSFQAGRDLQIDGIVGPATAKALGL